MKFNDIDVYVIKMGVGTYRWTMVVDGKTFHDINNNAEMYDVWRDRCNLETIEEINASKMKIANSIALANNIELIYEGDIV